MDSKKGNHSGAWTTKPSFKAVIPACMGMTALKFLAKIHAEQ